MSDQGPVPLVDRSLSPSSGRLARAAGFVALVVGALLGMLHVAGESGDVEVATDVSPERRDVTDAPLLTQPPRAASRTDVANRESGWMLRILGLRLDTSPTVALPTGDRFQEAERDRAGEWVLSGTGTPDFSTVYVEQDGRPTARLAVEWRSDSGPVVQGSARSPSAGGRVLRGYVSDGLGQPVPRLRVLVSDSSELSSGESLGRRRDAAERTLRRFATATTDAQGAFAIENWTSEAAFCAPLDPGWAVIRPQLASLPRRARPETPRPEADVQLVVGKSIVVGARLRLVDGSEVSAVRFPGHFKRLSYIPPPHAIARSPELIGDLRASVPESVRVLDRAILLDSTQSTENVWPAGSYVFQGPGFRSERIDLPWTSPGHWTSVTLTPSIDGPRTSPRTRLDVPLPAALAGASVPVQVRSKDGTEWSDVMVIGDGADELTLVSELPSGDYEISTPLLAAPLRVSLPLGESAPVSALRKETATLVVEVEAPSGATREDFGVLLRRRDDFPARFTSAADLVTDAPVLALRRSDRGSALLFEVAKDQTLRLWLVAAGPGLRSETREVELRSGETIPVQLTLRRTP
jgi:hypothetical protein